MDAVTALPIKKMTSACAMAACTSEAAFDAVTFKDQSLGKHCAIVSSDFG